MEEEREEEGEEETCHQAKDPTSFFFKQLCGCGSSQSPVLCALQRWEAAFHQSLDEQPCSELSGQP